MRVLITGHDGYIGSVLAPLLARAGHDVVGLDSFLFEGCTFGPVGPAIPAIRRDLRDVRPDDLRGFDAVVHLAALCNDPLGNLNPDSTYGINHRASVRLAELSRAAGVRRWLFASSCSLYGQAGEEMLTEEADFNPITPYGESKVLTERDVTLLASDDFSPSFLRNATAYGVSPKLRLDIVVNNLVGYGLTTGKILIQSDGTPWRPLVHVEDIARAFQVVLEGPREVVHAQAFNVGRNEDNLRVSEVAAMVQEEIPGCSVQYAEGGGPDPRSYRVDCGKLARALPFRPQWTVRRGIAELHAAYRAQGLTYERFTGDAYLRIKRIQTLQADGRIDADMRWTDGVRGGSAA